MNKTVALNSAILVIMTVFCFASRAQENDPVDERWDQMEERINYQRSNQPQGPSNQPYYPPQLSDKPGSSSGGQAPFSGAKTSEEKIKYSREKLYNEGSDNGVKKRIKDETDDDLEDLETPDAEAPDYGSSEWENDALEQGDGGFWKILFIAIGVVLLALILYQLFFKNKAKPEQKVVAPQGYQDHEEINPEQIEQAQLESDLEKACRQENYRLATRILYTSLLKSFIQNKWITWEKKKTNYQYLLEFRERGERSNFEKSIRLFEWVWYGKHEPEAGEFDKIRRFYERFLNRVDHE
ncbi:MAG: hypothetical protein ACQERC_02135 [Bacteroidota bacterium]